ncbi:hypothetical protein YC2023_023608 [Brassica napus]
MDLLMKSLAIKRNEFILTSCRFIISLGVAFSSSQDPQLQYPIMMQINRAFKLATPDVEIIEST